MSKQDIINALNDDRADELAAIIQYMHQHYTAQGMESPPFIEMIKSHAMDEMKHAEMLAERIVYLGGEPTTQPSVIKRGGTLRQMIETDLADENAAIAKYKEHIKLAEREADPTTRVLLEKALGDEEGHANALETLLGISKK